MQIQMMKNEGFSKRHVADKQGLNFRTVAKYWDMTPEEIDQILNRERRRNLSLYEGVVTDWLKKHPDMSASQILDWLKEHYQVSVPERTARRFGEGMRKKYSIPKVKGQERQFAALEDPPMGQQMQVDLGVAHVFDFESRNYRGASFAWHASCPIPVTNGANGTSGRWHPGSSWMHWTIALSI